MVAPARQLSDANVGGTGLGQNAADLISFHGATPVSQVAFIPSAGALGSVNVSATLSGFTYGSSSGAVGIVTTLELIRNALIRCGLVASS